MPLWGKTTAAADKPKYLTSSQKANTVLTTEGWVFTHPGGREEVLVALGNPYLGPLNTAVPTISGTAQVGQTLTSANGTWTGSPTFTRQWESANTTSEPYSAISGATNATYVVGVGQLGKVIRVAITGANAAGSNTAYSVATAAVIAA